MHGMSPIRRLTVSPVDPDPALIAEAAATLRGGRLVAFPTETVYGLGANALDEAAIARIYAAKGRPESNPLIVHVADASMAARVVASWPASAEALAEAFWPGPLTLVLPRRPELPLAVTAGLPAVGVRVPAHPVARALIRAADLPIAAPSANMYMGVSPTTADHVAKGFGGRDADVLILDGGPATVGLESTVLDLTCPVPTVLRLGGLPVARLREVLGEVAVLAIEPGTASLPSPGLARRHYAPRARLVLVPDGDILVAEAARLLAAGARVGAMVRHAPMALPVGLALEVMPGEPAAYGAKLYAALHALDELRLDHLLVEAPPADEAWAAVHDRLRRAATP